MIQKCLFILLILTSMAFANKPETPGSHKNNKCDNGSKYTFDVFIPKAYATKKDKHFPVLYISSPGGKPNFMKLEKWADEREFILITVNESKNKIPWETIFKIQDDVMNSTEYLRKHHCLQFATGFSGSAWASVHFANRYPKKFAGVFMNCHSGNGTVLKDKGCSVTLVSGQKDKIHGASYVENVFKDYKKRGFHTKYENLAMGHSWAPLDKKTEYLDFMYSYQKFANKNLSSQELTTAYKELEQVEIKRISEEPDKKKAMAQLKSFLAVPKLMKSKLGLRVYQEWGKAAAQYIGDQKQTDPAGAYFFIMADENMALIKKAPSAEKSALSAHLRDLQRNKEVIAEIKADKDFQYYVRSMKRVKNKKSADKLVEKIEKFMQKYLDTKVLDKAKDALDELRKIK